MAKWETIEGKFTWDMKVVSVGGYRLHPLRWSKGKNPIATFYWHPGVKEIVMDMHEVVIKRETHEFLKVFYYPKMMRFYRKRWEAAKRNRKEAKL